jgi:hypothetical protein
LPCSLLLLLLLLVPLLLLPVLLPLHLQNVPATEAHSSRPKTTAALMLRPLSLWCTQPAKACPAQMARNQQTDVSAMTNPLIVIRRNKDTVFSLVGVSAHLPALPTPGRRLGKVPCVP